MAASPRTVTKRVSWGPSGTPSPVNYAPPPYPRPTPASSVAYPGGLAALFRGPGQLTSVRVVSAGIVTVGFQAWSLKSGMGPQLMTSPTPGTSWLNASPFGTLSSYPGAYRGDFLSSYVWPVQEIANGLGGSYFVADPLTSGSVYEPVFATSGPTAQPFSAGQILSFQSSFANGYCSLASVGTFSYSSATWYWGSVVAITYTFFAPLSFDDECRVQISPILVDGWLSGFTVPVLNFTVALTATAVIF